MSIYAYACLYTQYINNDYMTNIPCIVYVCIIYVSDLGSITIVIVIQLIITAKVV